jgi:hypothetical protein
MGGINPKKESGPILNTESDYSKMNLIEQVDLMSEKRQNHKKVSMFHLKRHT